jgi:hypothetical protein
LFVPTIPFDPQRRVIEVRVQAISEWEAVLTLLVDTGASMTGIREETLIGLGIDPHAAPRFVRLHTASEVVNVPIVTLPRLEVFGASFAQLPVACLRLPMGLPIDGVLGNDVLSHFWLFVHFRRGLLVAEQISNFWRRWRFWWQVMRAS